MEHVIQNTAVWVPASVGRVILLDGGGVEHIMKDISSTLDQLKMQLQVIRKLLKHWSLFFSPDNL